MAPLDTCTALDRVYEISLLGRPVGEVDARPGEDDYRWVPDTSRVPADLGDKFRRADGLRAEPDRGDHVVKASAVVVDDGRVEVLANRPRAHARSYAVCR